jgi:hypothetical protein
MKRCYFLGSLLLLVAFSSFSREQRTATPGSVSFLISSCQEYVELYQKKNDERFGAFLTTSKEESFRAGYCLGAIMHAHYEDCRYGSNRTYQTAEIIASMTSRDYYSESDLLERAVCR